MAIALQDGGLVWQKVRKALAGANPADVAAFKALREYIASQKGNIQLQFIPFSAEDIVTNLGYSPDCDANTVYGCYIKGRRTSGTTAAFFSLNAATDNSATTATIFTARFKAAGQAYSFVSGTGLACETELTASCATAVGGATESSAADACDGFVLVGA